MKDLSNMEYGARILIALLFFDMCIPKIEDKKIQTSLVYDDNVPGIVPKECPYSRKISIL